MKPEAIQIIERVYCNRVERYVRLKDGSLLPLDVWQNHLKILVSTDSFADSAKSVVTDN